MSLTGKQKKYLKRNLQKKSLNQIASQLGVTTHEIEKYLKKIWGEKKYHKFVSKTTKKIAESDLKEKILSFNFKTWLKQNWKILGFLTLLVFIAYFNSLGNEFVSDDTRSILENKALDRIEFVFSSAPSIFQNLHLFIIYKLFGRIPSCFRLINILFHLGTVLTSYLLVYLMIDSLTAFLAAAILAVHPIAVESVAWISGGPYPKYSFFLILAFLFFVLSGKSKKNFWLSQGFFLLSLFSSEKAMVLPLILLTYVFAFKNLRKEGKQLIIPFVVSSIWMFIYVGKIPARLQELQIPQSQAQRPPITNLLLQLPIAIVSYLELILWPKDLTLYHSELTFSLAEYWARAIIFLVFLGIMLISFKRSRQIFFWLSFFIISLLPNLTPFGISWLVAERYVYLGSIGIFVVIALLFAKLIKIKKIKTASYIFFAFIIIALSIRTVVRNIDWRNQDNLWLAAAKTSPSSAQNHNNLGDLYGRRGDFEKAVQEFKKAIELRPGYADAYHNLANTYHQIGEDDKAIENYKKAIEFNPNLWQSYQNLAAIYFAQEKSDKALESLEMAIKVDPQNSELYTSLGILYKKMGQLEEAKKVLQTALVIDPQNLKAKQLLLQIP